MMPYLSCVVLGALCGFTIPHLWNYATWKRDQHERGVSKWSGW